MKLYTCTGAPSPRRVTLFLAEKGLDLATEEVDLRIGEHLTDAFAARNPECTVPVLELDDGTCLWESTAIRQYLEALHPDLPLLGRDPLEQARITQWVRWLETNGFSAVAETLRNSAPRMKDRALTGRRPVAQIEALAERGRRRYGHFLDDLDQHLARQAFIVDDSFTVADIDALVVVDFGARAIGPKPDDYRNIQRWYRLLNDRPALRSGA